MEVKERPPPEKVRELYLKGVDAYKNENYEDAIKYFEEALKLDPKNEKAKAALEKAKKMQEGIPVSVEMPEKVRELYLKGVEAYAKGNYEDAIKYFEEALKLDPKNEKAKANLERAERKLGVKPSKAGTVTEEGKAGEQPESKELIFASVPGYDIIRVGNENINKRGGIGETNIPRSIKSDFEKGEETDWEKIIYAIIASYNGIYIGAFVDDQGRATSVIFYANGKLYRIEWEIGGLSGDYQLLDGRWLKFTIKELDVGLFLRKREEPPQLKELKEFFEKEVNVGRA